MSYAPHPTLPNSARWTDENGKVWTVFNKDYILQREIARLEKLIKDGLPACYNNDMWEYACDVGPDFSWNEHSKIEYSWCVADPKWLQLAAQLKAERGFDMLKLFTSEE